MRPLPPGTGPTQPTRPRPARPPKIFGEFTGCTPCELREDLTGHGDDDGDEHDRTAEQLQHTDTRWHLELDNAHLWLPESDLPS